MFCRHCGNKLADGFAFCSKCGAKTDVMPVAEQVAQSQMPVKPQKLNKKTSKTTIVLAVLLILAVGTIFGWQMFAETDESESPAMSNKILTFIPEYITVETDATSASISEIMGDTIFVRYTQRELVNDRQGLTTRETGLASINLQGAEFASIWQGITVDRQRAYNSRIGITRVSAIDEHHILAFRIEDIWNHPETSLPAYESRNFLMLFHVDGSLIREQEITEIIYDPHLPNPGGGISIGSTFRNLLVLSDGRILIHTSNYLQILDHDWVLQSRVAVSQSPIQGINFITASNSRIFAWIRSDDGITTNFYSVNIDRGQMDMTLIKSYEGFILDVTTGPDFDLYVSSLTLSADAAGLYEWVLFGIDFSTSSTTEIFSYQDSERLSLAFNTRLAAFNSLSAISVSQTGDIYFIYHHASRQRGFNNPDLTMVRLTRHLVEYIETPTLPTRNETLPQLESVDIQPLLNADINDVKHLFGELQEVTTVTFISLRGTPHRARSYTFSCIRIFVSDDDPNNSIGLIEIGEARSSSYRGFLSAQFNFAGLDGNSTRDCIRYLLGTPNGVSEWRHYYMLPSGHVYFYFDTRGDLSRNQPYRIEMYNDTFRRIKYG